MSTNLLKFSRSFKLLGKRARSIIGFGLIFFITGFLGSIILPFATPALYQNIVLRWLWGFVIAGYVVFVTWFALIWKDRDNYITLSDQGIALCSATAQHSSIKWDDILKVDAKTHYGSLIVHSKCGRKIRISYESENLQNLLDLLSENLWFLARGSESSTFRKSPVFIISHINCILLFTGFAVAGWFFIRYVAFFFLLFTLQSLKVLLTEWSKITISPQKITIRSAIQKKDFPLPEIRNVILEPFLVPNSGTTLGLRIDLRGKDPLTLTYFDGIFQAYLNLRQMVEKSLDASEEFGISRK